MVVDLELLVLHLSLVLIEVVLVSVCLAAQSTIVVEVLLLLLLLVTVMVLQARGIRFEVSFASWGNLGRVDLVVRVAVDILVELFEDVSSFLLAGDVVVDTEKHL